MATGLCKLRCFPPVTLAWDPISGLHITPNLYSETVIVDSAPAMWDSSEASDRTTVLLLVRIPLHLLVLFSKREQLVY